MCTIAESNVLLRAQAEMPSGFKVATDEFRDGWGRMRSGGTERIEKKVQSSGWNFVRLADGSLRSGVGETSQQAIASALKLALLRVGENSNAVEVQRIELTQYPWFFLARVLVHPYRIQQGAELPAPRRSRCPVARPPCRVRARCRRRRARPRRRLSARRARRVSRRARRRRPCRPCRSARAGGRRRSPARGRACPGRCRCRVG